MAGRSASPYHRGRRASGLFESAPRVGAWRSGHPRSRSGTDIKLHLSALIFLVSSTAYLACGTTDDKQGSSAGGASGASAGDAGAGGDGAAGSAGDAAESNPGGSGGTNAGLGSAGAAESGAGGGDAMGGSGEIGVVTIDTFAFYHPSLTSGADGVLHLAFHTNESPSTVYYARCAADCGASANWTVTPLATHQFAGASRLVVGSDNRLHLLFDLSSSGGSYQLMYATCASNCTRPASWTTTDLASLFGGRWDSPAYGAPLVIDDENRLSFTVDRKSYTNGGVSLATCASKCSTLSNWSTGTIRATGTRTSLAARGTTLYQLIDNATGTRTGNALSYRTCQSDCTQAASWQELAELFVYDGEMPNAIAVTAEGGVRVAYNQGVSDAGQSADVKSQDGKLLIWGCESDCLQPESWTGFPSGAVGDGKYGISMAEHGGALVLAVSNGDRVLARFCGSNCLDSSSWQEANADTVEAMSKDYDPVVFVGATCSGETPQSASWDLTQGVVTIRPDGAVAIAHTASILRICPSSTSVVDLPGLGRLVFAP